MCLPHDATHNISCCGALRGGTGRRIMKKPLLEHNVQLSKLFAAKSLSISIIIGSVACSAQAHGPTLAQVNAALQFDQHPTTEKLFGGHSCAVRPELAEKIAAEDRALTVATVSVSRDPKYPDLRCLDVTWRPEAHAVASGEGRYARFEVPTGRYILDKIGDATPATNGAVSVPIQAHLETNVVGRALFAHNDPNITIPPMNINTTVLLFKDASGNYQVVSNP